jgi:hypothetical protein
VTGRLTILDIPPAPLAAASPLKRALWKWILAVAGLFLLFLAWQCGSAVQEGRRLANSAVGEFHEKLNRGQYEEIYREADDGFARMGKHDELVRFLEGVHARLGSAGVSNLDNMRVNATTGGTFVVAQYSTSFDQGSAVETFTWIRSNGALKLSAYTVQSNAPL